MFLTSHLLALAVFTGGFGSAPGPADEAGPVAGSVEVRYLGNEGFLLTAGDTRVLIDAIFGDGLAGYPAVPADVRREIETASSPFDEVDLVLATHHHGDHFDASAVRRFLEANPRAVFVSTPQAVEGLGTGPESLADRVQALLPSPERPETVRVPGVEVRVFSMHHGRDRPIQNLGFLVELGGARILHVGDTEVNAAEISLLRLAEEGIDLALLPPWVLGQEELVRDGIGARHLGLMHLPARDAPPSYFGKPGSARGLIELLQGIHPNLIVFPEPGAAISVGGLVNLDPGEKGRLMNLTGHYRKQPARQAATFERP